MEVVEVSEQQSPYNITTESHEPAATPDVREALAAYAHEAWSGWMRYMFSKAPMNADGSWTMPAWAVERWSRQQSMPYRNLPESEKASDRAEADKMLSIAAAATGDAAIVALVEEVIQAYSGACADWATNSMRELLIEEQIAEWRARLRDALGER